MFKHFSLRARLLASSLLVLAVSLSVIGAALLLLISQQPLPREASYQRLAALMQGINLRNLIRELGPLNRGESIQTSLTELLEDFANTREVRVMQIRVSRSSQVVLYDSANTYQANDVIVLLSDTFTDPQLEAQVSALANQVYGSFSDPDGSEWLFGGIAGRVANPANISSIFLLAEPRPNLSLQSTLQSFSSALLPSILQAGAAGMIIAIVLAVMISRNIARPLQWVAQAAPEVAAGRFELRVPVSGPPEVRAVARAFNLMSEEVSATQQSQRDFLANVSHDLKTPLTSIQGYSQAIIDGTAKNPSHAAGIIYEESERLNRMVTELTDLARIQAGRLSMQASAIDMGEIAAAVGQRLAVVAHKKGVELHVEATRMPDIAGDGDRLAQVLTNLISNAIKYTPAGGHVFVKTQVDHQGVEVIVQDTGIGILQKDLPRVFERFYQVDKSRGPDRGTGLGLAIVNEIVHAHGGRITVYSEGKNKGTTFTIWLPSPQLSTLISRKR